MILDDPSTINGWLAKAGPINLKRSEPQKRRDLRSAHGILTGAAMGAAFIVWSYVFLRWFLG